MELNLKQIQNIDDRTKMLIHGFNNRVRKLFPQDVVYYNIPSFVNHICLLFYWQKDYFAIFDEEYIKLSDDKMKAISFRMESRHWISIYGDMIFDNKSFANTVIEYEMVTTTQDDYFGAIGIASAGQKQERTKGLIWYCSQSEHKQAYTLHLAPNGNMFKIGDATMKTNLKSQHKYASGDKIRMIVDIPGKSVIFWAMGNYILVNPLYFGIMVKETEIGSYSNIDFSIKYRMTVSIDVQRSIELIKVNFSQK